MSVSKRRDTVVSYIIAKLAWPYNAQGKIAVNYFNLTREVGTDLSSRVVELTEKLAGCGKQW